MEAKVTRIYTGQDGESHFEDVAIPLKGDQIGSRGVSAVMKATGICFMEQPVNYERKWHHAPRRQMIITIAGEAEMEVGDGTKRRCKPGDVVLAEDSTGRGHISRVLNNKPRKVIIVTLE